MRYSNENPMLPEDEWLELKAHRKDFTDTFTEEDLPMVWEMLNNHPENVEPDNDGGTKRLVEWEGTGMEAMADHYGRFKLWQKSDDIFHLPFYELEEISSNVKSVPPERSAPDA